MTHINYLKYEASSGLIYRYNTFQSVQIFPFLFNQSLQPIIHLKKKVVTHH
jgi:hypothetical protein